MEERILCAAIWYKEFDKPVHSPINIDRGVVLCGHRHGHVIGEMKALTGLRTVTFADDGVGEHVQGFLTSKNRFVGREEAAKIALACKQIEKLNYSNIELYSEDLY